MSNNNKINPLATEKIGKLILKFATPAIISFLVSAMYNIVDQIFIGQGVGLLGNAATNVAFPLTTISTSIALLLGVGGASNFNLKLGAGNTDDAGCIAGNCISLMVLAGTSLSLIVLIFLNPLMSAFGSTSEVLPYALTYTGITSLGIPFFIFSTGCSQLIRSDGSPTYAMFTMLIGAAINTILDPLFIFVFDMGIAGAAWATVIGQVASSVIALRYLYRFKTLPLTRKNFKLDPKCIKSIVSLGAAPCFNQLAMTLVQITMNNTLTYYGSLSQYGSEIPLACVGVISKVNIVFMAFTLGIAQGCQPISGYNYGARNYKRVKDTYLYALLSVTAISFVAFCCFQIFPKQIISIFGQGSKVYFEFSQKYFRIYMFMTFLNGIHPVTANFFTSIGKAKKGILLSLTRQIIFLLPLIIILPLSFGIEGVMYAGPIADSSAVILSAIFIFRELKYISKKDKNINNNLVTKKSLDFLYKKDKK